MKVLNRYASKIADICGIKGDYEREFDPRQLSDEQIASTSEYRSPMADMLLYDSVDSKNNIFYNSDASSGFWFEISPLVGSNSGLEKNLTLFFNDELPVGGCLQFLIVASNDVSPILNIWERERKSKHPALDRLTKYRKSFIQNLSSNFAAARDGRLVRNYRSFITYSIKKDGRKLEISEILEFKKKLFTKLEAENFYPKVCTADDLIDIAQQILQMQALYVNDNRKKHDPVNSLNNQVISPLREIDIDAEEIVQKSTKAGAGKKVQDDDDIISKIYYPKEYPSSFSLSQMIHLLGSSDRVIPGRFVISYVVSDNLGKKGSSRFTTQGSRSIHASTKEYTKDDLLAKEEANEWRKVLAIHKKGERFLSESMQVMITAPRYDLASASEILKSLWNTNDWKLEIARNVQLPCLLSILPMMQSSYFKTLSFFRLTRFALSGEIVAKLPLQGEWKGVPKSGVLMHGRRGQLMNFNPFYRIGGGGNYNIAMMAPSGSGKSFLLQELVTALLAQDTSVFVMDIGASYKNICHLLGGEMVRFNSENKMSLNPFASLSGSGGLFAAALNLLNQGKDVSTISQITGLTQDQIEDLKKGEKLDSIEVINVKDKNKDKSHFITKDSIVYAKSMLSAMCAVAGDPRFEAIIERAILQGISIYGNKLDITKVAEVLSILSDDSGKLIEGASSLADSLYPYTENGIHGRFFKAGASVNFKSPLTVFEFEELVNDTPLLSVVLQVILMQITSQFLCGNRQKRFLLVVDEAWMILDYAAYFLERLARTVRKYGGSLVICTQDLSSFTNIDGSRRAQAAILECCTWKLILQQKGEGIAAFAKAEGYKDYLGLIKSVRKCSENKYSEILIDTDGAKVVGRFAADPYSTAAYSTEDKDFAFLMEQERKGASKHDAIALLAKKYGHLPDIEDSGDEL